MFAPFLVPLLQLFDQCSLIPKDVREFFTGVVKQTIAARKEDNDKVRAPGFTETYHKREFIYHRIKITGQDCVTSTYAFFTFKEPDESEFVFRSAR